ncbi:MAG: preprotein translocase subunit SecG [Chloroflexi bacterium]|nr:preprotein translocase subunit SecG [Chloroflexota bacterium]
MNWAPILHLLQIFVAIILVAAILLQVRTQELGGIFTAQATVFRARRGLEKTLFQATIVLAIVFVLLSVLSARLS